MDDFIFINCMLYLLKSSLFGMLLVHYVEWLFRYRINRRNFAIGWIVCALTLALRNLLLEVDMWIAHVLANLLLIPFVILGLSLCTRRINDLGIARNPYLVFLFFILTLPFFIYLLLKEGQPSTNEDGPPPPSDISFPADILGLRGC